MTAQPERVCAHCGQPVPADQAWTVAFIAPRDNGSERAAQRELGVVHLDCAAPYLEPLAAPTTSPATPGEGGHQRCEHPCAAYTPAHRKVRVMGLPTDATQASANAPGAARPRRHAGDAANALHGKRKRSPPPTRLSLLAQWTSPDTIGADELFWRGVLDPRDRALDEALVGQPR